MNRNLPYRVTLNVATHAEEADGTIRDGGTHKTYATTARSIDEATERAKFYAKGDGETVLSVVRVERTGG